MLTAALLCTAFAGAPSLTLMVENAEGDPVSSAMIVNPEEGDKHVVNSDSGHWTTGGFYLEDGREILIEKGGNYELWVLAPGYASQKVSVFQKGKKSKTAVTLEALEVVVDNTADPSAKPAVEAYRVWRDSYFAYLSEPSDAAAEESRKLATAAEEPIRVWLDRADGKSRLEAWNLCMHVSSHKVCGEAVL